MPELEDRFSYGDTSIVFDATEIELDLDARGMPGVSHFICPLHREGVFTERRQCVVCGRLLKPVYYRYQHDGVLYHLWQGEVIHVYTPQEDA